MMESNRIGGWVDWMHSWNAWAQDLGSAGFSPRSFGILSGKFRELGLHSPNQLVPIPIMAGFR